MRFFNSFVIASPAARGVAISFKRLLLRRSLIAMTILFFLFISLVYLNNATRDVYSGDIGDLVTAAYTFGIPHPPGYPLLTFLGFIFTHLPFPVPPVTKMAYVSVIASLVGLAFFFAFSLRAAKSRFIAFLSTSILAFSYPFWIQTEIPEVFALSHSLLIIIFYFAIRFYEEKKHRYFYLTLFFMGLSLTNQHAIIAVFPAVGVLLLGGIGGIRGIRGISPSTLLRVKKIREIFYGIGAFFLGLLPYIYVPIAASANPKINWLGGEATFDNFIWLVMRKGYTESYADTFNPLAESIVGFFPRLIGVKIYAQYFIDHYSIIVALLCLVGILALIKKKKVLLLSLVSGFILSGPLFIFLIFPPLTDAEELRVVERLYMHSFIVFLFLMPFGLHYILMAVSKLTRPAYSKLFLLPLFIIPIVLFLQNFPKTNLSETNIGNNLGYDILSDLPKGSAVFLEHDLVMFNTWYVHHVLGERSDVELIHPLSGGRNIFWKELLADYVKSNPEKGDQDYDPKKILPSLLVGADKKRPVFLNFNQIIASSDYILVPNGLLLQLKLKKDIPSKELFVEQIQTQLEKLHMPSRSSLRSSERNQLTPNITRFYSRSLVRIGNFVNLTYDDAEASTPFYKKAIEIDHENSVGYAGLGYAYFHANKDCAKSEEMFEEAISLTPFNSHYYTHLYQVLKECSAGDEDLAFVKSRYKSLFKKNIEEEPFWKYGFFGDT